MFDDMMMQPFGGRSLCTQEMDFKHAGRITGLSQDATRINTVVSTAASAVSTDQLS